MCLSSGNKKQAAPAPTPAPAPKPAPAPAPAPKPANPTADGPVVGGTAPGTNMALPPDPSDPNSPANRRKKRQTGIFSNILTTPSGDPLFGGNTLQRATFGGR